MKRRPYLQRHNHRTAIETHKRPLWYRTPFERTPRMAFSRPRNSGQYSTTSLQSSSKFNKNTHNNLRLRDRFEQLLKARNVEPSVQINSLRQLVLTDGIPEESTAEQNTWKTKCTLRGRSGKFC